MVFETLKNIYFQEREFPFFLKGIPQDIFIMQMAYIYGSVLSYCRISHLQVFEM